jgi:hypothetical protein
MSAIFISHSSKDNDWAERIRDWLDHLADSVSCYLLEAG